MKHLRKTAGVTIFFILVFMVIAVFRYHAQEEVVFLPDQLEFDFNEGWVMVSLKGAPVLGAQDYADVQAMADEALKKGMGRKVALPYEGSIGAGDSFVFQNMLPEEFAGLTMAFSSGETYVRVFLDGEVIYQYAPDESTYGIHENFVDLPQAFEDGELWIALTAYDADTAALGDVIIETRDRVVIGVVGNNIADIGCCLLIVIMAIIMFVLAVIRRYTNYPTRGEIYLGLTGLTAGIYCFIGTDTLNIFYDVQEAYEMQEYLILLLPLFLTLYFERNLHARYPRRFSVLLCCVSINAALQIALQISGICKLEELVNVSALCVGVVCVTAIVSLLQFEQKDKSFHMLLSILSMLVLLAGGIANVIMNTVFCNPHGNAAGQYSMTLFGIIMAVMHIFQLSREYRADAEEKAREAGDQNMRLRQAKKDADAARQEAMAANEAKGKFLAHMSHEIRTPINAIIGMDEMILRESKEQDIREYAMDIYTAGQTLLSLIQDILDFSRIDSGKMEIVPVEYDISSLIHDLTCMALQRAADKNIRLETKAAPDIPSRLYGDDVRLRQVLANILTNAVKYTREGCVWLRISCRRRGETAVLRFEVEDTGIGIRQEDLPKLFAEFERIEEERNRNIEGSGLGMSITIRLLALMGSRLQVESEYGKGSKFYFELEQKIMDDTPSGDYAARVRQAAREYHYTAGLCAPDARILVVDDNAVNRKVLRSLLKQTQIQIVEAESGARCLALAAKEHFDLIFLDHMMPEMDGVETLHRLRAISDGPCRETPIVVLTANAVSGAKKKYLAEGFDDFLSKPVVPEKLEAMIRKMLPRELQQEGMTDEGEDGLSYARPEAAKKLPDNLVQVDGLDWQYAWMHLPEEELLAYTVREFYDQIGPAGEKLEQAFARITEKEWLEQYRILVHAMKSLAATIGLLPLSGLAKILEYAAKDGKMEVILRVTGPFLEEWRSYREKLRGVFGAGDGEEKKEADDSVIQALVEMVRISMREMDIDGADQAVAQLAAYTYPQETEATIRGLRAAVTDLDQEETERLADLVLEQIRAKGNG